MGGGGAIRAAGRVAGFSVNGGLRGASSVPLADSQSVSSVARKSSRPVGAIVSSSAIEDGKSAVLLASQNGKIDAAASVQRPSWEIDDWEFAGDEEELLLDSMHPLPRVVFRGVPTLEEAKEATSDLNEALDMVYFSSSSATGCRNSTKVVQESSLSVPLNSGYSESVVIHPSVPKPIFQAFSLLKESPEAQCVVASLASDKNVWDAVMQNEKVMEFIKSQQTTVLPTDMDLDVKGSFADNEFHDDPKTTKSLDDLVDGKHSEGSENGFMDFIQKVKVSVAEMVSNLSGFFQNLFGGPSAESISVHANGSTTAPHVDSTIGASFMALAVLAIMVIVLKRG